MHELGKLNGWLEPLTLLTQIRGQFGLVAAMSMIFSIATQFPFAQSNAGEGWQRPSPLVPYFWQDVAAKGLDSVPLFAGPHVRAIASVAESVPTGNRIAFVAAIRFVLDENNQAKGASPGEISEARFIGADSAGVSIEVRDAKPSSAAFYECFQTHLMTYVHTIDFLYQTISSCGNVIQWGEWRPLRFPLSASLTLVPGAGQPTSVALPLAFTAASGTLRVTVQTSP